MINSFETTPADAAVADRVKVALAICVGGEIFSQVMKRPNTAAKALRVKMAADALDKTLPDALILQMHEDKPADKADSEFLLENVDHIMLLGPERWPARKVQPHNWGEYTKVMRGMETFLKKAFSDYVFTKSERADIEGVLRFIAPQVMQLKDGAVKNLLQIGVTDTIPVAA
jgi:hypothetical protein